MHILKNNNIALSKTREVETFLLVYVQYLYKMLFFSYLFKIIKLTLILTYLRFLLDKNIAFDNAG